MTGSRVSLLLVLLLMSSVGACRPADEATEGLEFDLERMIEQQRADAYEASDVFEDGMVMRRPPDGTVAHESEPLEAHVRTGRRDGAWVSAIPVQLTRELVERGRERFDVYCAPCHGFDGNAATPVAGAMTLTPPPSLHATRVREHPAGLLYAIVRRGFGLMPGYEDQLPVADRWAVVAYVRALQLGQEVHLDSLPPALGDEITDSLVARTGEAP